MRRKRFFWQLFSSYLLVTIVSLLAVTWYISRSWKQLYLEHLAAELEAQAHLLVNQARSGLAAADTAYLDALCKSMGGKTHTRFTVILPSGVVLGDSALNPEQLDNFSDRPEIRKALQGHTGISTRISYTLGQYMMMVAIPVRDQGRIIGVMRAAIPATAIDRTLKLIYFKIGLGGLMVALLAAALSVALSRRITRPLEEMKQAATRFAHGDLSRKVLVPDTDELASLAEALNAMAAQLDDRIRTILGQRHEHEAILSSMVEGVIAVDANDHLIRLNQAGARLLGVDVDAVQHRSIQEVIRNPDLQWFVMRAQLAIRPIEGEIVLKGEEERFIQAHGTQLRDVQGKPIGALIVMHDITRLRRLENARRDFVANVSHELRTPITSIKGFVETLMNGALTEPEHALGFLQIIARQADRLNQIIADLLSLSRLEQEAEQLRVNLTRGPLKEVLEAAFQDCVDRATAKDIRIVLSCPEELQARINAPLLEQALVNLLDNAVKYSPVGSTVKVEAREADQEVVIQVRDQGSGIAREHLPRIFERFYRVDPSRSRKIGGTGLGLAIVKHIAQAHRGQVTVDSTPGQGSVFTLHLPRS